LLQTAQLLPPFPHWPSLVPAWHSRFASQHPEPQVAEPHGEHTWFQQILLVVERQSWHGTPFFPQLPGTLPAWHWPFTSQHPLGQVLLSHETHVWVVGLHFLPVSAQFTHGTAFPQLVSVVPGWHAPVASQQPLAQSVESHAVHDFCQQTLRD
jgi:hypothetical protein